MNKFHIWLLNSDVTILILYFVKPKKVGKWRRVAQYHNAISIFIYEDICFLRKIVLMFCYNLQLVQAFILTIFVKIVIFLCVFNITKEFTICFIHIFFFMKDFPKSKAPLILNKHFLLLFELKTFINIDVWKKKKKKNWWLTSTPRSHQSNPHQKCVF